MCSKKNASYLIPYFCDNVEADNSGSTWRRVGREIDIQERERVGMEGEAGKRKDEEIREEHKLLKRTFQDN